MSVSSVGSRRSSTPFFARLKRERGEDEDESYDDTKRMRRSSIRSLTGEDRFMGPRLSASFRDHEENRSSDLDALSTSLALRQTRNRLTRSMSGMSYPPSSRASSEAGSCFGDSRRLTRSASMYNLSRAPTPEPPARPPCENSAHHHMRPSKVTIDFSVTDEDAKDLAPMAWSRLNTIFFGRGNRVHFKRLFGNEEIGQLCKLRDSLGSLRVIASGGADQPAIIALGTSKGQIQLWDIQTKKMVMHWSTTKSISAMAWNGPTLTVGTTRGTIRHFDTRIKDTAKMKEQAKKYTRHQAEITCLAWNIDGTYFASGDSSGCVYVWDTKQRAPLDVGDVVRSRRKMQHNGPVRALAWCPWLPKLFASGDAPTDGKSTIHLWDVRNAAPFENEKKEQHVPFPTKLELDAQVTSLHFSPHCKELLSTHGPGCKILPSDVPDEPTPTTYEDLYEVLTRRTPPPQDGPSRFAYSIAIHSWPRLTEIKVVQVATTNIAGSVLSPNELRVLVAVPEESKLKVWDVWAKKELRRVASSLEPQLR